MIPGRWDPRSAGPGSPCRYVGTFGRAVAAVFLFVACAGPGDPVEPGGSTEPGGPISSAPGASPEGVLPLAPPPIDLSGVPGGSRWQQDAVHPVARPRAPQGVRRTRPSHRRPSAGPRTRGRSGSGERSRRRSRPTRRTTPLGPPAKPSRGRPAGGAAPRSTRDPCCSARRTRASGSQSRDRPSRGSRRGISRSRRTLRT